MFFMIKKRVRSFFLEHTRNVQDVHQKISWRCAKKTEALCRLIFWWQTNRREEQKSFWSTALALEMEHLASTVC